MFVNTLHYVTFHHSEKQLGRKNRREGEREGEEERKEREERRRGVSREH